MTMTATAPATPGEHRVRYKMKLAGHQFLQEYGGHLDAGEVVLVDEETAIRWLDHGIAQPAKKDEVTAQDRRRDEAKRKLLASDAQASEDEIARAEMRPSGPRAARRGRKVATRADLAGAGVLNSLDDVPDQVTAGDDEDDE